MTKKQERGAIMVEVLAVLALIGVMGPMLYKQVLSRNQEISNVNIAAEMRAIKEAMSAAIAADGAVLGEMCKGNDTLTPCESGSETLQTTVEEFLPIGMEGILDDGYGYIVKLYSEDVTLSNGENYPLLVGIVAGTDLASDWNMKRTARIANLIGTDGGIAQVNKLVGTGGSWNLPINVENDIVSYFEACDEFVDRGTPCPIVVATTAMDTFDPDLGATEPNAVAVPGSLAFNKLHAWNYFSVGTSVEGKKCFKPGRTVNEDDTGTGDVVNADDIKHIGENGCDPLFWVGTTGSGEDRSMSGQVYVKNNLYIGRDNGYDKNSAQQAFAFEAKGSEDHDGKTVDDSRIVVYNIDGNDTLTIDATGKIVSDKTINVGGMENADGTYEGGVNYNYGLDVANTSVLNDVRLGARGGARLSDILPNYISKGIYQLSSTATNLNQPWTTDITKPACPENYAAAVIVTPLKWGASTVQQIVVPENTSHDLNAPNGGGKVTGAINAVTVSKENITQYAMAIEVSGGDGDDNRIANDSTSTWVVKMGYKNDSNAWIGNLKAGEIQALAQTYCVYAPNDETYDPNALMDETKIPDNLKK